MGFVGVQWTNILFDSMSIYSYFNQMHGEFILYWNWNTCPRISSCWTWWKFWILAMESKSFNGRKNKQQQQQNLTRKLILAITFILYICSDEMLLYHFLEIPLLLFMNVCSQTRAQSAIIERQIQFHTTFLCETPSRS